MAQEQPAQERQGDGREARKWELTTFQNVPYLKASDQWNRAVPGWLIRIHGKKRSRLFHPLHHKTPNLELHEERTTILFTEDNIRLVRKDRWTSSSAVKNPEETHGKQWKGLTFFRVKPRNMGQPWEMILLKMMGALGVLKWFMMMFLHEMFMPHPQHIPLARVQIFALRVV
eukprot:s1047_g11.t1